MSVTCPLPDSEGIVHTAGGEKCFFCGHATTDPAVHWAGETGEIFLHPDCTDRLLVRLARDRHEIDNDSYYTRRAARAS